MTPFEAHILIKETITTGPGGSSCPKRKSISSNNTKPTTTPNVSTSSFNNTTSTESVFEQALKSHRLNPNIKFKNESLLSTAIKKSCPNLLKLFLEHGADPNLKSYENGRYEPALITAVRYKSLSSVQILLEYGANLRKTNFYGTDAIFQAVHENAFEILECLLCNYKLKREGGQQQTFHNHGHPHNSGSGSTNEQDYQKRQQRRQKDVPASALPESSLLLPSSSTPPRSPLVPQHQSITIQKTTTTKGKDLKGKAIDAVVLNREKSSHKVNNNSRSRSSKGHDDDDDDSGDDDHVLCPFYYALNYALSYPCKRESLARLLQSYYKCKCLQEIAGCRSSCRTESLKASVFATTTTTTITRVEKDGEEEQPRNKNVVTAAATTQEEDEAEECWKVVQTSWENFSTWWWCWYEKSVPPAASYGAVRDVDGDSVRHSKTHHYQYRAHDQDHDPITSTSSFLDFVDNVNDDNITFQLGAKSSSSSNRGGYVGGGEGNELSSRHSCSSNLFPYKIYKIQGKCHVIKENESSSASTSSSRVSVSSSSQPAAAAATTETRGKQGPSSSYVVLVGPLKLSCITREVIRDQIMLCGSKKSSRRTISTKKSPIHTTTSAATNESTHNQEQKNRNGSSSSSSKSTVAPDELPSQSTDYFNRMNFRKSLETLMMPSSLMDYILYRNIQWSGRMRNSTSSSGLMMRKKSESELAAAEAGGDDSVESNQLSKNIKLIKRDLELNINYFAIYIY